MKRIWDAIVSILLAAVAYWKGRVDQEEKDIKETKEEIADANEDRKVIDAHVRDADDIERERLRKPYYRD